MLSMIALAATATAAEPIHLICMGGGMHRRMVSSSGRVSNGFESATVTMDRPVTEEYAEQVNLEIHGDVGRIRVPNGVRPALTYGGTDGWYPLKNLKMGDSEITAKFSLNFMNNPELRLDRITGIINIRGKAGNFSGQCEKIDPATTPKKF